MTTYVIEKAQSAAYDPAMRERWRPVLGKHGPLEFLSATAAAQCCSAMQTRDDASYRVVARRGGVVVGEYLEVSRDTPPPLTPTGELVRLVRYIMSGPQTRPVQGKFTIEVTLGDLDRLEQILKAFE